MQPKIIRVLVQVAIVFVLMVGFMMIVTAVTGRRSPWATGLLIAILTIVRGVYMWRTTPPNSPAKLVK
jgi:hypothetical protein